MTATDLAKNISTSVTTNESGNYEARSLIPGKYQVRVEQQGYKIAIQDVEARADVDSTTDVALEKRFDSAGWARALNPSPQDIPLVLARYGEDAGIAGAAALCELDS